METIKEAPSDDATNDVKVSVSEEVQVNESSLKGTPASSTTTHSGQKSVELHLSAAKLSEDFMTPSVTNYYNELLSRNELLRSDTSIFPSYTNLVLPYRVVCRQRYYKMGVRMRKQFIKEIVEQEGLQTHALDGVRLHRVFCNPIIDECNPAELITLTKEEERQLELILAN